jgi:alpha-1,3-rhamnosyl/mannosyltransferase
VDDLTKRALLQSASALVFPTLLEGFGLPVLEAFASGTPVITSNVSSLPEVAGDAAWMVDPMDVGSIADAMKSLVMEDALSLEFVARGLVRAGGFTWNDCARQTEQIYARVLGQA